MKPTLLAVALLASATHAATRIQPPLEPESEASQSGKANVFELKKAKLKSSGQRLTVREKRQLMHRAE
jgi:hypothetical protein